jgi:hypothetical protein
MMVITQITIIKVLGPGLMHGESLESISALWAEILDMIAAEQGEAEAAAAAAVAHVNNMGIWGFQSSTKN